MSVEPLSGAALWTAKLVGAGAGSAISVAYLLPAGRRDAAVRFLIGMVTGIVFGAPAGLALADHLRIGDALAPHELVLMGSAAASLSAWWALGILSRFASTLFRDADAEAGLERGADRAAGGAQAGDGRIAGYASLFGATDLSGDRILPGAFLASLARRGATGIRMLWQHDPARPIGVWARLTETATGLLAEGRLALETAGGREAYELIRAGAVDGLSIGFRTKIARRGAAAGVKRVLSEIDLWEISVVTFPMQERARLSEARGAMPAPGNAGLAERIRAAALQMAARPVPRS